MVAAGVDEADVKVVDTKLTSMVSGGGKAGNVLSADVAKAGLTFLIGCPG